MSRRTYGQYCGLANALDLIGERWTLLLVRDLALGPKRFTDLLAGLPGMGTSLLSERLRHLEDEGIARRAIAEPRGVVYELTTDGLALARAMSPLALWGATRLGPHSDEEFRPAWLMFALQASFDREAAADVHDCYEFRVNDAVVWVVVDDGEITVTQEQPREPDFVMTADVPTLAAIGSGGLALADAVASGAARFEGDPGAGGRALKLLGTGGIARHRDVPSASAGRSAHR
jgi:DNA-binding HxlR family transcriptional regulator/putative sterol carrier protein